MVHIEEKRITYVGSEAEVMSELCQTMLLVLGKMRERDPKLANNMKRRVLRVIECDGVPTDEDARITPEEATRMSEEVARYMEALFGKIKVTE